MAGKGKKVLLTLLEIALCLAAAWWLLLAGLHFYAAAHVRESKPWLVPETDPAAPGAMTTLEEEQGKWRLAGGLYIVYALPFAGAEAGLRIYRGKQRRKQNEHPTPEYK